MRTYYTADRMITGGPDAPGAPVRDAGVLVEGGAIVWAGPDRDLPASLRAGCDRVPLGPRTLLPGLVDAHVHLALDGEPGAMERMRAEHEDGILALMFRNATALVRTGVTTARDLGAPGGLALTVRDAVAAGEATGPSLVVSGPPLTVPDGHCWFMGGACEGEEELRAAVRDQARRGVDLVKIMVTGGALTDRSALGKEQFTDAELRAVVTEAARHGLRVAAHAHGTTGIAQAVRAGVHTIEHCSFVSPDGTVEPDLPLVGLIAAEGIHVCPTVSRRLTERWDGRSPAPLPAVPLLYAAGVGLIAGTDSGTDGAPHAAFVDGLIGLARLGLPLPEVLHAATSRAADALGLGGVTGRLARGLRADLIAVDGDPLTDLEALRAPCLVVARGIEVPPAAGPPDPPPERADRLVRIVPAARQPNPPPLPRAG
ncbi:amidohydrolase family protein [uncultured Streptomyces sp.]|uniref:metal-dependent hydrolase family protein n=1 Tax=uncultured Streptomyces sp. TaxID=174707 RepID=UPI002636650A|nr:amidohydrolase family protein [uncultured Streptomyces sp.]